MKEKRRYRRFDPLSTLAVLGCLAMLLFESVFIFEMYRFSPEQIGRYLPEILKPLLSPRVSGAPAPAAGPAPLIQIIPEAGPAAPVESLPAEKPAEAVIPPAERSAEPVSAPVEPAKADAPAG